MTETHPAPAVVYGAVYFRKSNPPREDWARDYAQAAADGMNMFRHWFMWSAIETAPRAYDWADYDDHLDLAAANGIGTIAAEHLTFAPEWAYRRFAGCELRSIDGVRSSSHVSGSSATGGHPGLCLDHPEVRDAAEAFLRALARRYRAHPGLFGYDLWNECNVPERFCYCDATVNEFRTWLKAKYETVEHVAATWYRHSLENWLDVRPPADRTGYPEMLDWLQFRLDHAHEGLRWRAEIIRSEDDTHPITAHGIAASLVQMAANATDDWRAAAEVDSYGFTWVAARKGNEPWKQWSATDLVRCASRGKDFWHAEAQGGPLWMQPQVIGRERSDGRIATPEDIRFWNLVSLGGGARGIQYPRWRPLLDGPLFGAFGPYGMDGKPTPRSEMASTIAQWANDPVHDDVWQAHPAKGEVGIVVVPGSQLMSYLHNGDSAEYASAMWGAYRGFFDLNVQADYVHIDDIDRYNLLYLPLPIRLGRAASEHLTRWVDAGGTLVSEGCPAYFGEHGSASVLQPGDGLREVFGARQDEVEFTPDALAIGLDRLSIGPASGVCGVNRQSYLAEGGSPVGRYEDGSVAVVGHRYGQGRTLLIGTAIGAAYQLSDGVHNRSVFPWLIDWMGLTPRIKVNPVGVTARMHIGDDARWLWIFNPDYREQAVTIDLSEEWGDIAAVSMAWGHHDIRLEGRRLQVVVGGKDAVIARLS
jgi:beta-galactosidase